MLDNYVIKNDKKAAYRVIDNEVMVVNLKKSTFHTLNTVGSFIWQQFDGKTPVKKIVHNVTEEFDVDFETAENDSIEFINNLLNEGLIIVSSNPVE